MDEKKTYQVTYKVYHNERLKKVSFHGKMVYPLYVRLTFDRRTTEYRSNLFDLYMKPKYGVKALGQTFPPRIDKIIEHEERLIDFVIDRHREDFSLELFKEEYDYFGRDLLDEMEPKFMHYVKTFFEDEGMPFLGDSLANPEQEVALYDVILDLKRGLNPDLYQRLIEHSFLFAPPYYALNHFLEIPLKAPLRIFTIMDWTNTTTQERIKEFVKKLNPVQDSTEVIREVDQWVKR